MRECVNMKMCNNRRIYTSTLIHIYKKYDNEERS
jgi:hypothetical protein